MPIRTRVLFVEPLGVKNGTQVVLSGIVAGLDRSRFEPLVSFLKEGPFVEQMRQSGVPTFLMRPHKVRELHKLAGVVGDLARLIRENNVDLVHCNGSAMLTYGGLAARRTGRPAVWHVYDAHPNDFYSRAFIAVQRRLHPAWTIFGTPPVSTHYLATYKQLRQYSMILPGVDVGGLLSGADGQRARTRLGIPDSAPIICVFARLQRYKGFLELVEAVSYVLKSYPDAFFVLCGGTQPGVEPDFPDEIRARIQERGVSDRVILTGYVSDDQKRDILAACTMLVHPALEEPFGISVIEGMAVGKPVVATDCVGPSLIVQHEKTGLLIPRGDVGALAGAILRLLGDPELARRWGDAGQRRVAEEYSVQAMVRQVEQVYDQVLASWPERGTAYAAPRGVRPGSA